MFTHEPADATAKREPGDTGVRDGPARGRESMDLGFAVEVGPQHATLGAGCSRDRVDMDALHAGEVDLHASLGGAVAGRVVGATADGNEEIV